jgi:hypothetical protein
MLRRSRTTSKANDSNARTAGNEKSGERGWVYLTFHWRNQFQILDAKASRQTAKLGDKKQKQAGSSVYVRCCVEWTHVWRETCQMCARQLSKTDPVNEGSRAGFLGPLQPDALLLVQIEKKIPRTTFSGLESSFSASEVVEAFSFSSMASFSGVSAFS